MKCNRKHTEVDLDPIFKYATSVGTHLSIGLDVSGPVAIDGS